MVHEWQIISNKSTSHISIRKKKAGGAMWHTLGPIGPGGPGIPGGPLKRKKRKLNTGSLNITFDKNIIVPKQKKVKHEYGHQYLESPSIWSTFSFYGISLWFSPSSSKKKRPFILNICLIKWKQASK